MIASTASEYPLADFLYFQAPCPKTEKSLVGISQTIIRSGGRYAEQKTEYTDEVLGDGRRKAPD